MRVGLGYDIHPLRPGRKLVLGGMEIHHWQGLDGHSDADALVHAICDALLGAMGSGDLGTHFPSTDPQYKNASSLTLLKEVGGLLETKGYRLVNLDTVIVAQAPRLGPHLSAMQAKVSEVLEVGPDQVNVKVKSGDKLDAVGREEAIAAHAICLIDGRPGT